MTSTKTKSKIAFLIGAFVLCYFYLDFYKVKGLLFYLPLGVSAALIYFSLFHLQSKLPLRIFLSLLAGISIFFVPRLQKNTEASYGSEVVKLVGVWETDTSGGYSVRLKIDRDSAFLSQSNINAVKGFELIINDQFLQLSNERTGQFLSWRFELFGNAQALKLFSKGDSLSLKRLK